MAHATATSRPQSASVSANGSFTDGQPWFDRDVHTARITRNTVWNNKDNGPRSGRSLDLRALIGPEEQRQFAKVVISDFKPRSARSASIADVPRPSHAGAWLPKTMYDAVRGERALAGEFDSDVI
jgi:hypothetical protein